MTVKNRLFFPTVKLQNLIVNHFRLHINIFRHQTSLSCVWKVKKIYWMMYPVRIVDHGVAVGVVDQGGKQVMVLYGIVLYCTILYYTVLYCSIPYYTVLYCTILYYTVLYRTVQVVEQQGGAGGGARWSKEQGGREGAENGVDYQVWSSVQCPVSSGI